MNGLGWLIWLLWSLAPEQTMPDEASMRRLIWDAGRTAAPQAASAAERVALKAAVPLLLDAARGDPGALLAASAHLTPHRLEIARWAYRGERFLVLREAAGAARGFGAYLFREGAAAPLIVLQAPHAYFDRHTGAIAISLFFDPAGGVAPRALFVNTVHRYGRGPRAPEHPADPCDSVEHPLSVATAALARPGLKVVQLHGFSRRDAHPARVVISGAARPASPEVARIARRLRRVLPDVALFPDDVDFLGAQRNAQASVLRGIPGTLFVHVELDQSLRARLRTEHPARRAFADALLGAR